MHGTTHAQGEKYSLSQLAVQK